MRRRLRWWNVVVGLPGLFLGLQSLQPVGLATEVASVPAPAEAPTPAQATIQLEIGEVHRVAVDGVTRVAIGEPEVADLTVISPTEVLIQPKAPGVTNLIVWDRQGQRSWEVRVGSRSQQAAETQLRELLKQIKLPHVSLEREQEKLFLVGTVAGGEEADQLERLLEAFPEVTNLVRVLDAPAATVEPAPLIKLAVQIIDVSRSDLEELGVSWSQSITLTEPEVTDVSLERALTRIGTSLTRSSFAASINALVQRNRARILAEPKLVTASGKEASSFVGVEVPIIKATSFSTETTSTNVSVEFRETGVLLTMTPYLNPVDPTATPDAPRTITTIVKSEVSKVDSSVALGIPVGSKTISVPGFKVRKTNTEVTTVSGGSIVIAGLLEVEDTETVSQVPALGSMPVLGRLFKKPKIESSKRELVIVVTPELFGAEGHEALAQLPQDSQRKAEELERAVAVAEVSASTMSAGSRDPVVRYATQVQERIGRAIRYPRRERDRGRSGQVKLRLHLFRDGRLEEATVAQSSGVEAFDQEALSTAQLETPYPPFPQELEKQDIWLELPVVFSP